MRAKLAGVIALVYVAEGFPMGVFVDVVPVFLRRQGVSLAEIGGLSALALAWSLKVFWSPLVDRFGERRDWISGPLLVMAACLLGMMGTHADGLGLTLWLGLALYCLASATQDISIDAYTIDLVDRGDEGPANAVRINAYRVGMIVAGSGLLLLPERIGWGGAFAAAAAFSVVLAGCVRLGPRPRPVAPEMRREVFRSLKRWLAQGGAPAVFGFVLLYRVGDRAMGPMVKPFWVDRGFSNEEIALVSVALGAVGVMVGTVFGAIAVSRWGIPRSLVVLGGLALLSNLGFAAAAALPGHGPGPVYAASISESVCYGLASVAFMSYLMRISEKEHAAVQYALLTAIYGVAGTLIAIPSGWLTERIGYAGYFALTAIFALPAFALLSRACRWLEAEAVGR